MSKQHFSLTATVAVLALAAAAVSAHAQSTEGADFDFVSAGARPAAAPVQVSRAVQVVTIRASREVDTYGNDSQSLPQTPSQTTREAVRAEVLAGMRAVQHYAFIYGENIGPFFQASYEGRTAQPSPERMALAKR